MTRKVRIGCGAGFSGDRISPAVELAKSGNLDYLVFECLAERTIALAQKRKLADPDLGYDPLLEERISAVLPHCAENNTRIITNMGAANVPSAGKKVKEIARNMNLGHLKIGLVLGDDVLDILQKDDFQHVREPQDVLPIKDRIISANAYIGSPRIIELLEKGVDIIITGRTCDISLFLAPMKHELGWKDDDLEKIGLGIAVGHIMECAGQATGGYFADPGLKDVEDLANLGYPIVEVSNDSKAVITKLQDAGGEVSLRCLKEQLLYEVHDPSSYKSADGFSDFTRIKFEEIEKDRVRLTGGLGTVKPSLRKVTIGYKNGFLGEAQIAYGGGGALQRAKLACEILEKRLQMLDLEFEDLRFDHIGTSALWPRTITASCMPKEIILRAAGRSNSKENVQKLCNEVEALYTNGPAGGGGVRKYVEESISVVSTYIPKDIVKTEARIMEGDI